MSQMRTITYTVDFNTQGATTGAKKMSVTMTSMEQDSKKAAASFDKLGKSLGTKFKADVSTTLNTTKSLAASMRQGFKDAKKTEMAFNSLGNEYKLLSSKVGRTANQQEQLNAIYKLGPTATLSQKKATVELVKAYQLQRDAMSQNQQVLKQASSESQKAEKNYNDLSREFKLLSSRVGRTANQQEQLNALYRLGSTATLTQKKRTLQLVKAYQLQRAAGATVQKSFRGMRGQMQNFGYQMQDVAVQMQMGTNAMTIFSQQGSQLAAGFGPTGAIVGAGIAFAGMMGSLLLPALFDGDKKIKALTESLKELASATGLTKEQASVLASAEEDNIKLAQKRFKVVAEEVAQKAKLIRSFKEYEAEQDKLKKGSAGVNNQTIVTTLSEKDYEKSQVKSRLAQNKRIAEMQNLASEMGKSEQNIRTYNSAVGISTDTLKKHNDENKQITKDAKDRAAALNMTTVQVLEAEKVEKLAILSRSKGNALDIAQQIASTKASYNKLIADAKNVEMAKELKIENDKRLAALKKQASEVLANTKANESLIASVKKSAEESGLSTSEILKGTKSKVLAKFATDGLKKSVIDSTEADYDKLIAAAESIEADQLAAEILSQKTKALADTAKKEALVTKGLNERAAAQRQLNSLLASLNIGDTSQLDAQYAEEQKLLEGNTTALLALQKEYLADKKEITDFALNEQLEEEKKLLSLRASLTDQGKLDQLRSQYEEEKELLKGHKTELEALERNYESDRLAISGTAWEQYLEGIKTASMDFEKISADMLEGTIENLSSGIGNAIVNADNLGDAFKNTFKSVAAAGISALVQMGIQRLLFSTLDTGLKTKEVGAHVAAEATKVEATLAAKTVEMAAIKAVYVLNVGGRGAAETALGALNAAASTAAIPIVGPVLAPAAAAAFTAFGTAQTAAAVGFAGAFDKGGVIPQNQMGIVSEYGDELVDGMLVKGKSGGTRVTGREDTAKIMSGGGGNNTFNITSSGNVSPEAIARAVARSLKKPNKVLDTMVYDSVTRGSKNRGKRFA